MTRSSTTSNLAPVVTPLLTALVGGKSTSTASTKEGEIKKAFEEKFGALAKDKAEFHALMKEVYGADYDATKAEALRQRALKGDYSWLPKIKFVDAETLGGANGAYDKESGTVLLNSSLDAKLLASTFLEESAHHLDTMLKTSDTAGDEGEMFRRLAMGEKLTDAQKAEIRAENDKGTITVDGKRIEVEFWNPFKAVKNAVKGVANGVVSAVKGVGKAVVSHVSGTIDGVTGFFKNIFKGNIGDAFGALWKGIDTALIRSTSQLLNGALTAAEEIVSGATHLLPFGKYVRKVTDRLMSAHRTFVTGVFDTAAGLVRGIAESAGTFMQGVGKLFKGDFKGAFSDMGYALFKYAIQNPIDAILLGAGKAVSAIQTLLFLEPAGRKLTDAEIATLKKVYGDTIDYDQVVIKEGFAGVFSLSDRPFTHGNTIYLKDETLDDALLIHEMGHVWQHQNGGTDYLSESLAGQWWGNGYEWEKDVPATPFEDLNPEQQAEFLEDAFKAGYFDNPAAGFIKDGVDYTAYLERALELIRSGRGAP